MQPFFHSYFSFLTLAIVCEETLFVDLTSTECAENIDILVDEVIFCGAL
jgi:hypothetical protein